MMGHGLELDRQAAFGRWCSNGLQRAPHHSRPEERPPRTTPVAIIAVAGRRWVWAPWGDVQWVRNLRAASRATITVRRQNEEVTATELDPTQRIAFFRDVLGPLARSIPFGVWFIRTFDGVDLDDPVGAAAGRRVFELHPLL
jgi:hypothetical protein